MNRHVTDDRGKLMSKAVRLSFAALAAGIALAAAGAGLISDRISRQDVVVAIEWEAANGAHAQTLPGWA
jgi:hypothetical protein